MVRKQGQLQSWESLGNSRRIVRKLEIEDENIKKWEYLEIGNSQKMGNVRKLRRVRKWGSENGNQLGNGKWSGNGEQLGTEEYLENWDQWEN